MGTIERLRGLERAATPGPWRECGADRGGCICGLVWSIPLDEAIQINQDCDPAANIAKDAALIAAMRNTLPALLAVVEAARRCDYLANPSVSGEALAEALARLDAVKL